MPKLIDYPRSSFMRCLDMAAAVDYLGGNCSQESCALRLGVKVTGAFTALVGAAKKHGLVESKKDALITTEVYKNIKLAYDESEKRQNLRIAFLNPPLYKRVYDRFKGKELPVQMLEKLFIREFGVEGDSAQRVSNYFIEGARTCEILVDNKVIDIDFSTNVIEEERPILHQNTLPANSDTTKDVIDLPFIELSNGSDKESFTIHITGPGMNSKITVLEEDDFIILDAMISKLKKKMIK